jgi:3'-5' exoribonuclease
MNENKGRFIADLKETERHHMQVVVSEKSLRATSKGKPYLQLLVADRTGTIDAKVWDDADFWNQQFVAGDICKIACVVDSWNNKLQLKIEKIRKCADGEYTLDDFILCSKFDPVTMFNALFAIIDSMQDDEYRRVVENIVIANKDAFVVAPAAMKMHHAFRSGLLEHTLSVAKACDAMSIVYRDLNRDLLLAGAILHDLGKVAEQTTGLKMEYTVEGQLTGHIFSVLEMIHDETHPTHGMPIHPEKLVMLKHMIVSHHGVPEWGAVKRPAIPEAIVLHHVDMIDAGIQMAFQALDGPLDPQGFTEKVNGLQTRVYKSSIVVDDFQIVGTSPDPDYRCGADYCDDPACHTHGNRRIVE